MNKFPEFIKVFILTNSKPLVDVLFYIILLTEFKNNITLGPFLTNNKGEFELSKILVATELKNIMSEFPMDYSTCLEEIKDIVQIQIDNKDTIENKIQTLSKFYPDNAIELISKYEKSVNRNFKNNILVERELNSQIIVSLT